MPPQPAEPQQTPDSQSPSISSSSDTSHQIGNKTAWTGKFVTAYGGYAESNQGLIFKRTDGEGGLHKFTPDEAKQLRASNNDLIKESMQNGSQGKDVQVTFSTDGRGSLGVQPLEQSQSRRSHG